MRPETLRAQRLEAEQATTALDLASQSSKPLSKAERALVDKAIGLALSFTSPLEVGSIFEECGWSPRTEISILVDIASDDGVNPRDRMTAAKFLRHILTQALVSTGLIAAGGAKLRPEDRQAPVISTATVQSAIQRLKRPNQFPSTKEIPDGTEAEIPATPLEAGIVDAKRPEGRSLSEGGLASRYRDPDSPSPGPDPGTETGPGSGTTGTPDGPGTPGPTSPESDPGRGEDVDGDAVAGTDEHPTGSHPDHRDGIHAAPIVLGDVGDMLGPDRGDDAVHVV